MSTLDFYQLSLLHFAALSRSMNHSENQPLLKILLFIPFQHCGCRYDSPYMRQEPLIDIMATSNAVFQNLQYYYLNSTYI